MAFIPVDKAVEVIMVYLLDGQRVVNTVWFKCVAAPTTLDLTNALSLTEDLWNALAGRLSGELSVVQHEAHDRTTQVGAFMLNTSFNVPNGQADPPTCPNNVAVCVSFGTGFGNRSARGRNFIAGIPSAVQLFNSVDGTFANQVANAYGAMRLAAPALNLTWCVASKYHDNAPRPLGVMTPITSVSVDPRLDTQRRRMPGTGS